MLLSGALLGKGRTAFLSLGKRSLSSISKDKIVVTAALNGVLTDPAKFQIPVTPEEMATAASEAYDAGASRTSANAPIVTSEADAM